MTFSEKSVHFFRAAVISCVLAYPAQALPKDHALGAVAAEAPQLDIYNFGQIDPNYFRGAELKGSAASDLAKRGVKTVIDLRGDDFKVSEAQLVTGAGMKYVRIPMSTRIAPTTEQISQFLSLVTNPANQPVYVHCVEGRHRTGVMTAIYRMNVEGWTAVRAFDEMKDYKFGMDFLHPEFKKFVFGYVVEPAVGKSAGSLVVASATEKPSEQALGAGDKATVAVAEKASASGEKTVIPVVALKPID